MKMNFNASLDCELKNKIKAYMGICILLLATTLLASCIVNTNTASKVQKELPTPNAKRGKLLTISLRDTKSDAENFPIRTGVPFPEGALKSANNICLWNADQTTQIPTDVKLVSSWKDGSVRWIQLCFQADIFKDKKELDKVILEYGGDSCPLLPARGKRISVYKTANGLSVNAGKLKVDFENMSNKFMKKLYYDLDYDGKFSKSEQVLSEKGASNNLKVFRKTANSIDKLKSVIDRIEVEEAGKIQTTIKISGNYMLQNKPVAGFIVRCYFYYGKGFFRFDHVFTYKSDPEKDFISDLNIRFNLKSEFVNKVLFGKKEFKDVEVAVLQDWWNRFKITGKDNKLLKTGDKFEGCASVLSRPERDLRISFFVKNFWEKYPKAISVSKNSVEIGLWPVLLKCLLDLRRYSDTIYTEDPDLETVVSRLTRSAQGVAVYHKFFVDFSNIASPMKNIDGLASLLFEPPVPYTSPEWLRKTDVFGNFDHKIPKNWPRLWNKMKLFAHWHKANQKQFAWYGMLDFGDWRSRYYLNKWAIYGRHGWANNSGDPIFGLMFAYLIGGDVPSFRMADEVAEHYMNVDICHYADNTGSLFKNPPELVGSGHRHGRQHWSGYLGSTGYTYPVGMCQYYFFTGEERYRDALHAMGKFLAATGGTHCVFSDLQWISEAFMHEEKYQKFVKTLNTQIKKSRDIICSEPKKIDSRHPVGWPSRMGFNFRVNTDNMPGLLLYVRRNKDSEMMKLFPKMADMFLKNYKMPKNNEKLSYKPCFHFLLPYAAYLATKDKKYLDSYIGYYSKYLPKGDFEVKDNMSYKDLRAIEMSEYLGTTNRTYQDIFYLRSMPYIAAELSELGYNEKSYLNYAKSKKGAK